MVTSSPVSRSSSSFFSLSRLAFAFSAASFFFSFSVRLGFFGFSIALVFVVTSPFVRPVFEGPDLESRTDSYDEEEGLKV